MRVQILIVLCVLAVGMTSSIKLTTLDMNHLMLLNVAVKGRLVSRLSDAIATTQTHRRALVDQVKDCLIDVASSHAICRKCVTTKCEERARECRLNMQRLDTILVQAEKTPIPGMDIINPDASIRKGVEDFTQEAEKNIIDEVPYTMKDESEKIVEKENTKTKLELLRDSLQHGFEKAVESLPEMLPKVKQAIDKMNTDITNPLIVDDVVNDAMEQLSVHEEDPSPFQQTFSQGKQTLSEHLPGILKSVQSKMSEWMSNMGKAFQATTKHIVGMIASNQDGTNDLPDIMNVRNSDSQWASGSVVSIHVLRPDGESAKWASHRFDVGGPGATGLRNRVDNLPRTNSDQFSGDSARGFPREDDLGVPRIHIDPMPTDFDSRPFEQLRQPGNIGQNNGMRSPGGQNQPSGPLPYNNGPQQTASGGSQSQFMGQTNQQRMNNNFPSPPGPQQFPQGLPPPNLRPPPFQGQGNGFQGQNMPPQQMPNQGQIVPQQQSPNQIQGRVVLPQQPSNQGQGQIVPSQQPPNQIQGQVPPQHLPNQGQGQHVPPNMPNGGQGPFLAPPPPRPSPPALPNMPDGRRRRSVTAVNCKDIDKDPQKACQIFHFHCATCLNESLVLKQACGPQALKTMVDIKKLDLKTATYLLYYDKYMKNGLIVEKVEYDKNSFSQKYNSYQLAYITAKIGNRAIVYQTSSFPAFGDMVASGGLVGDEIWQILDAKREFAPDHFLRKDNDLFNENSPSGFQGHKSSASHVMFAVNSVVFGVLGTILYMGLCAF